MEVREQIKLDKHELKQIFIQYFSERGYNNLTSLNLKVGNCVSDLVTGNGYCGVLLEAENIPIKREGL